MNFRWIVIEDNGGGLYLVVMNRPGTRVYYFSSGYEYRTNGSLLFDISCLEQGEDPRKWDGNSDTPDQDYKALTSYEYGWQIVASGKSGKGTVYFPDRMGAAAHLELKQ